MPIANATMPLRLRMWLTATQPERQTWVASLALVAVALVVMSPFVSGSIQGGGDSLWYRYLATDVILQVRRGTFPVYAGDSVYNFTGYPTTISLLFFHLFVAVDWLTLQQLSPNRVFNTTIILFGLLNALIPFAALKQLLPQRTWLCAALALLFFLSPSTISVLYTHDMYPSFCATPFVPAAMAASVIMTRRPAPRAAAVLAGCLAVLWMIHAPTGFMMSIIAALIAMLGAILPGRSLKMVAVNNALAAVIFVGLSGWYFAAMFAEQISNLEPSADDAGSSFVADARQYVLALWPGALLPVDVSAPMQTVQIGYALILVFLASLILAARFRCPEILLTAVPVALCSMLLFPVPFLNEALISILPRQFNDMMFVFLYQKLYKFVAGGIIISASIVLGKAALATRYWQRLAAALIMLLLWSGWEVRSIVRYGFQHTKSQAESDALFEPNRVFTLPYNFMRMTPDVRSLATQYDAILFDRIIDSSGSVRRGNWESVASSCHPGQPGIPVELVGSSCDKNNCTFPNLPNGADYRVGRFTIPARTKALIIFDSVSSHPEIPYAVVNFTPDNRPFTWVDHIRSPARYGIPVSNPSSEDVALRLTVSVRPDALSPVVWENLCFARYDSEQLPVQPLADPRYAVTVSGEAGEVLETRFNYLRGLRASIDGVPVEVIQSPRSRAAVPLLPGRHVVRVYYQAPPLVKVAMMVSLGTVINIFFALAISRVRNRRRKPRPRIG
jgi:hypothetical protein